MDPDLEVAFRLQPRGAAEGPRSILYRKKKKKITCTVFESWRVKGFKTSKALQIAINTLNYPASLKAFMLLFFPTQEQAPDCGCLERNIQKGVEPGGRRGGEGREGSKRLRCPGRLSLAGWQETAGNCVGLLLSESCVPKARWGPPLVPGGSLPCS